MSTQVQLLAGSRQKGESSKAVQACNDWLRQGPGRSVAGLARRYQKPAKTYQNLPPSRSEATLKEWSLKYGWRERADAYDALLEDRKNARAEKILSTGLALDHERVAKLKRLARLLEQQLYEVDEETGQMLKLWLPDVKQIGSGEDAERVNLLRFNSRLVEQLRAVYDDIAREVGGRRQGVDADLTTKGEPLISGISKSVKEALDAMTPEQVVDKMWALYGSEADKEA